MSSPTSDQYMHQLTMLGLTQCENCGEVISQDDASQGFYQNTRGEHVMDDYCSVHCKETSERRSIE